MNRRDLFKAGIAAIGAALLPKPAKLDEPPKLIAGCDPAGDGKIRAYWVYLDQKQKDGLMREELRDYFGRDFCKRHL